MAELTVHADLSELAQVHEFVTRTGRDLCLSDKSISDLQLVVDEAYSNIVKYAYDGQGGIIKLTLEAVDGRIEVTMHDWGAAFDPESVAWPDVMAPLEKRSLGGLGLFLMKQIMDQVDFQCDPQIGNKLVMVKQLQVEQEAHTWQTARETSLEL